MPTLSELASAAKERTAVGTANALITLFASAKATMPEEDVTLAKYIEWVGNGRWSEQIANIRAAVKRGDRERLEHLKRKLPAITMSCSMTARAKDALVRTRTHSGWLQCDFDGKNNPALVQDDARAFLRADPHIGAVFVGPSGVGIKAALRIDGKRHIESWHAAAAYFLDKYALSLDASTKDVVRLCFASHDPDASLREEPALVLPIPEDVAVQTQQRATKSFSDQIEEWNMADVRELLGFIPSRPNYESWRSISYGVFSVLPFESAVKVLSEWSPEEKPGEYALFHKESNSKERSTIATVIYSAQAHGFDVKQAIHRQRWLGRFPMGNGKRDDKAPPPHADLIKEDEENAPDAHDVWQKFEDQQIGDARFFVTMQGQNLVYDGLSQCWRHWNVKSGLWEKDFNNTTHLVMSETVTKGYEGLVETLLADIKEKPKKGKNDPRVDEIELLKARCRQLRSAKYIRGVMELVRMIPDANRPATAYDRDRHLLAVANGVLDFEKQLFRPANRGDRLSVASPAAYDPGAGCPAFDAFLERVLDHDQDLIDYWWRIVGYSLTGFTDHDALFFCHGEGANGKSTAFLVLRMLLGDALSTVIDVATLLGTSKGSDATLDYKKSMLEGKRLILTDELPASRKLSENMVKGLLGGEDIVARRPYEKPYTFSPTHKIWMVGNHKPKIVGTDHGIWRRIHLIPWTVTIPESERRPRHELLSIFRAELSGILLSALHGYQDVLERRGIDPPKAVLSATEEYRGEEDSLAQFIEEQIVELPGCTIPTKDLFKRYSGWCKDASEEPRAGTARKLSHLIQRPPYNLEIITGAHNARIVENRCWADDLPKI